MGWLEMSLSIVTLEGRCEERLWGSAISEGALHCRSEK